MTRPIKPSEIAAAKKSTFPSKIFDGFNNLIAKNYNAGSARVTRALTVNRIANVMNCTNDVVYARGWLSVEDVYRAEGWKVEYDKPDYDESYGAFFIFKG